jgi:pimeloyl-ACP methyl ester carboxylesterase
VPAHPPEPPALAQLQDMIDRRADRLGRYVASSHFPFVENPAPFNAVVEEFLDRA